MGKQFNEKLQKIQFSLKAPKGQYNSFGKYHYRSCEDILEALKPLLKEYSCTLIITDDIVMIGDRFYVKATATLSDGEESISISAFAREEETKKGSDGSQVTGASSSYARKYALNGMFCIDDTKDSDVTNVGQSVKPKTEENPMMDMAMSDIRNAKTLDGLMSVWHNYQSLQSNAAFKALMTNKKKELNGNTK